MLLWGLGGAAFLLTFVGMAIHDLWPRPAPPAAVIRPVPVSAPENVFPVRLSGAQMVGAIHVGDSMRSVNSRFGSAGSMMTKGEDGNQGFMYKFDDGDVFVMADSGDYVRNVIWIRKNY
ncbi:MAG: hypothetical protein ABIY70_16070 [Capsulimonas sp.]|uniref:hypothetical protein n=1 Tax=Capsulimonas sp. TaxID=2494211 RepID=UPI00326415F4